MNPLSAAATGLRKDRETTVLYEVHREREDGKRGAPRPPIVEEFHGLDRARLAALSHALDGPTTTGDRFTGSIRIFLVLYHGERPSAPKLIDEIDERVASRLLNEVRLPRACELAVSVGQLQSEVDALLP